MKKIVLFLIMAFAAVSLFAQKDPFFPSNPITQGQGGSFTANAEGYNAFFYNPAGFARKSELTLASINVYGLMDKTIFNMVTASIEGKNPMDALTSKGLQSRGSTPDFSSTMDSLGDYFDAVNSSSNPNALSDAAAQIQSQYHLDVTIDPNASQQEVLNQLLTAAQGDPNKAAEILNTYINDVSTLSGVDPVSYNVDNLGDRMKAALNNAFPSGNMSAGVMAGLGYVGHGVGIGIFAGAEAGIYTPVDDKGNSLSLLAARGAIINTLTLEGGVAFNLWKGFSVGVAVRPTILGYAPMTPLALIQNLLGGGGSGSEDIGTLLSSVLSQGIYKGFRVGIDVGALLDVGPLTFGLAVKDLLPYQTQYYQYSSLEAYGADFPFTYGSGTAVSDSSGIYTVPFGKINVGVEFHPDLGVFKYVFDPRVGVDIYDILGFLRSQKDVALMGQPYNILKQINLGAEIKLLSIFAVRAGLNQGALTAGFGVHLLFIDLNASVAGSYSGTPKNLADFSQVGASIEAAIRF